MNRLHEKAPGVKGPWHQSFDRFCKNRLAVFCVILLVTVIVLCICAPLLTSYSYRETNLHNTKAYPSREHILGTDGLGRDLFTRMLYGGRITFRITFCAVAVSLIGLLVGMVSGYVGGKTDAIITRANDALASIPTLILVIFAENIIGWGQGNFMYAMGVALMPPLVRLSRTLVMNIMGSEYIEAARALGVSGAGIIFRHILKNVAAPVVVHVTSSFADAMLTCTIMGYLGIGVNPPMPEWGSIVHDGYTYLQSKPFLALIPCSAVVICVLSMNIIGNGLRDAFAPDMGEM